MAQAHLEAIWHLSRGEQHYALISDRELRLLAKLGRLHADDLLWRPGFHGWKRARFVPGLLTRPALFRSNLLWERTHPTDAEEGCPGRELIFADVIESGPALETKLHGIGTLICGRVSKNVTYWLNDLSSLAQGWLKSTRFYVRVYGRKTFRFVRKAEIGLETFLSRAEHPRVLAGLLAAAVLVGTIDIAMQRLADAQPVLQNSGSREFHHLRQDVTATSSLRPLKVSGKAVMEEATTSRALSESDHAYSIVKFQLSQGFGGVDNRVSEVLSNPDPPPTEVTTASDPIPLPTRKAVGPGATASIPLPTRKPTALDPIPPPTRKPAGIKSLNTMKSARTSIPVRRPLSATRKVARQPKPMTFGTISYNYSTPAL
jgi:hypothetical protein